MGVLKLRVVVVVGLLVFGSLGSARAGTLRLSASNPDDSSIALHWSWSDDPSHPVDRPDWVGFDLFRRSGCDPFVRINPEVLPRSAGLYDSGDFVDGSAVASTPYEYELQPVDADRNAVALTNTECESCAWTTHTWTSNPTYSAPVTRGTLEDIGWTLMLTPCSNSCDPPVYLEQNVDELRPYAASHTAVVLYGTIGCGSVEGCGLQLDHYTVLPCDAPVAIRRPSWGSLKQLYR